MAELVMIVIALCVCASIDERNAKKRKRQDEEFRREIRRAREDHGVKAKPSPSVQETKSPSQDSREKLMELRKIKDEARALQYKQIKKDYHS